MQEINVLKLKRVYETERRAQAIKLLEELTNVLAHLLEELRGDVYYEEIFRGFIWVRRGLYFRYLEHRERDMREEVGFYVTYNELPVWGVPLEEVKGKEFWDGIENICEWVENMLPALIEKHDKGSENALSYLKKIAEYISRKEEKE